MERHSFVSLLCVSLDVLCILYDQNLLRLIDFSLNIMSRVSLCSSANVWALDIYLVSFKVVS